MLGALAPVAAADALSPGPSATPAAEEISTLYWISFALAIIFIVAVIAGLLYVARKYRAERGTEPRQIQSGAKTQARVGGALAAVAIATFVVAIIFTESADKPAETGARGLQAADGGPTALEITATGQQWLWRYDYPNDAFSYYRLVIPVDTRVNLDLVSTDVVHSWFVPALGGKRDAVPNKTNELVIRADEEGVYKGQSAVLSGTSYAAMRIEVEVVSPQEYNAFLKGLRGDIEEAQEQAVSKLVSGGSE